MRGRNEYKNGAIDITTVTNEDLADKISKYQDWWKFHANVKSF